MSEIHLDIPILSTPVSFFTTPRQRPRIYPGTRPCWSYCFKCEEILPIRAAGATLEVLNGQWEDLDTLLRDLTGEPLAQRYGVLAVGANACPSRLAESDKFGDRRCAIPVLRGRVGGVLSVFAAATAAYGSLPATIMLSPGTISDLWLQLLTAEELEIMDKSEERGTVYDLIELPDTSFCMEGGWQCKFLCAYYQHHGLRDIQTGNPIRLECFDAEGAELRCMNQDGVQEYLAQLTHAQSNHAQKNNDVQEFFSVPLPLPSTCRLLPHPEKPSSSVIIGAGPILE